MTLKFSLFSHSPENKVSLVKRAQHLSHPSEVLPKVHSETALQCRPGPLPRTQWITHKLLLWPHHLTNEHPKHNPGKGHPSWPCFECKPSLCPCLVMAAAGCPAPQTGVEGWDLLVVPRRAPGSSPLGAAGLHCTPTKATFVLLCVVARASPSCYKQVDHIFPRHKYSRLMCSSYAWTPPLRLHIC